VVQGLRLVGAGLVMGLGTALLAAGALSGLLFEVEPRDVTVLAATVVLLAMVGAVAAAVPARRATRIDPASALRVE
jgi:ABC-type antimicrobial peptide transport system permease subunit